MPFSAGQVAYVEAEADKVNLINLDSYDPMKKAKRPGSVTRARINASDGSTGIRITSRLDYEQLNYVLQFARSVQAEVVFNPSPAGVEVLPTN